MGGLRKGRPIELIASEELSVDEGYRDASSPVFIRFPTLSFYPPRRRGGSTKLVTTKMPRDGFPFLRENFSNFVSLSIVIRNKGREIFETSRLSLL